MGSWTLHSLLDDYATMVMAFLAIIVSLSLWSALTREGRSRASLRDLWRGPSVRDVFLTIRLARTNDGAPVKASSVAHLRDMDLHGATIVSKTFLPRGERVRLEMPPVGPSTPTSFPEDDRIAASAAGASVDAEVARARRWRGAPDTWIVQVKFVAASGRGVVKSLRPYLERLAGGSRRWSHA